MNAQNYFRQLIIDLPPVASSSVAEDRTSGIPHFEHQGLLSCKRRCSTHIEHQRGVHILLAGSYFSASNLEVMK